MKNKKKKRGIVKFFLFMEKLEWGGKTQKEKPSWNVVWGDFLCVKGK